MGFLKRWLKEEFILFLWGWGIVLLIIIFSMIAVSLFPDIAINLIGLFVLLIIGFHVVVWFKVKNWHERGGVLSNPACLWLTDENDSPIIGSCLMPTRTGSIELRAVNHHVWLPTDNNTGKLTGTRLHTPVKIQKEFDRTTPLLFRALCEGRILRSATLKMYRINEAGLEVEYFNIAMANLKITAITPNLHPAGMTSTHLEDIDFRYETITWIYTEGNIMYRDSWNDRCCAW